MITPFKSILFSSFIFMVLILVLLIFLKSNSHLENMAYTLKWNLLVFWKNQAKLLVTILIISMGLFSTIFVFSFNSIKKYIISKTASHSFTNLMKSSDWNRQKKINTELSLKRLENSREYQNYLKEKLNGKYPEIRLEEDEKIKFSDED